MNVRHAARAYSLTLTRRLLLALGGADCLLTLADVARIPAAVKASVYKFVAEGKVAHVAVEVPRVVRLTV